MIHRHISHPVDHQYRDLSRDSFYQMSKRHHLLSAAFSSSARISSSVNEVVFLISGAVVENRLPPLDADVLL